MGKERRGEKKIYLDFNQANSEISIRPSFARIISDREIADSSRDLISIFREFSDFCLATLLHGSLVHSSGNFVGKEEIKNSLEPHLESCSKRSYQKTTGNILRTTYIIRDDRAMSALKEMNDRFRILTATDTLARASLSSIIAEYEFFLKRVAQAYARNDAKKIIDGSKKIHVNLLFQNLSKEELIYQQSVEEISAKLYGSHHDSTKWICGVVSKELLERITKLREFEEFLEACIRRNVVAHNGGFSNKKYVDDCRHQGVGDDLIVSDGEKVNIDTLYIQRAMRSTFIVASQILHFAMASIGSNDKDAAIDELISISHEMMVFDEWDIAEKLLELADCIGPTSDVDSGAKAAVNRALCVMNNSFLDAIDKDLMIEKIVKSTKWPDNGIFNLAKKCLLRDFDDIADSAKRARRDGLTYGEVENFRVFKEARDDYELLDHF